jgi:hypothetical protein
MMSIYQLKQPVSEHGQGRAATALLCVRRPLLSAWYGTPLSRDRVACLQVAAQDELQARLCSGTPCFQLHVLQLVCRFQGQADVGLAYEKLLTAAQDVFEQALLELVYGQLLISCKKAGAHQHLADGFVLAADYLASADYFQLVRQHELLACLPLSEIPSLPQPLESLLAEAAVIKQLQGGTGAQFGRTHLDTLG